MLIQSVHVHEQSHALYRTIYTSIIIIILVSRTCTFNNTCLHACVGISTRSQIPSIPIPGLSILLHHTELVGRDRRGTGGTVGDVWMQCHSERECVAIFSWTDY